MNQSLIRHLVANRTGECFLAAEFESTVYLFRRNSPDFICKFETVLDFGGTRLAFDEEKKLCITANYYSPGVACYDAASGMLRWERRDIRKTQSIRIINDGMVALGQDEGPLHVIALESGVSVERIRGYRDIVPSPFANVRFVDKNRPELQSLSGNRIATFKRESFAILDATFSPDCLLLSESRGTVRAINVDSGTLRWRFTPPPDSNVLSLSFNDDTKTVVAVLWPFSKHEKFLLVLNHDTGTLKSEVSLGEPATTCFCNFGRGLLTSDGWLFDTATGERLQSFRFPTFEPCE